MRKDRQTMERSALLERLAIFATLAIAVLFIASGVLLALHYGDPHWLNRSGAAVVAVEAMIGCVEVARRNRLIKLEATLSPRFREGTPSRTKRQRDRIIEHEFHRSEQRILMFALMLVIVGELLHGFGDLLLYPLM